MVQLGNPNFMSTQTVTFAVGDVISMKGFWNSTQFQVGMITKTQTGEMLMLRDPNGRPLWGGPGRTGQSNSQNTQTGQTTTQGNQGNQSNGNGYRGGR